MSETHKKLADILRADPVKLEALDDKMAALSGKAEVFRSVLTENDAAIEATLKRFSLERSQSAESIYQALAGRLTELDVALYQYLERPQLLNPVTCQKLLTTALELAQSSTGFFIKPAKAIAMLEQNPPQELLNHFGYPDVRTLVEQEGLATVVGALRLIQSQEWMHNFFDRAYDLLAGDFEERPVEIKILDAKWLGEAGRFVEHKFHNVSHLKEWGIIFIVPLEIDTAGEMLRVFSLLLHYLNEVPFYSKLFRRFADRPDFATWVKSLLRGDVLNSEQIKSLSYDWLIIQRYLVKDDPQDPRLFLPHINPEALHWHKAMENLKRLKPLMAAAGEYFDIWHGLDWVAGQFKTGDLSRLVSFNFIDLMISVVERGKTQFIYHQSEALWNKLFIAHLGKEKLEELIEENIINGYIKF